MGADENSELLEQHLKILGQKIRLDILKKISVSNMPLSYSVLQREVLGENSNSTNFSFHLKMLKNHTLIDQTEDGYEITLLGKKIVGTLLSIEQIINEQNKSIMIRTSKYATEPFNLQKVETYLINEGKMEKYHAKQIAKEVSERISKTKIDYLTTPLMREYINGILLENGLEEVRHRLTRLGIPPAEAFKLFKNDKILPNEFLMKLGAVASEEFLLLNLLPKELADLYLSSEILLLNLSTWGLKPLACYSTTKFLTSFCSSINFKEIYDKRDIYLFINDFIRTIDKIIPLFSQDLLIGGFNDIISTINQCSSNLLFDILISEIKRINKQSPQISLEFTDSDSGFNVLKHFLNQFEEPSEIPFIILNYSDMSSKILRKIFNKLEFEKFSSKFLFNNNDNQTLLNSLNIDVRKFNENKSQNDIKIVLDKIFINLHAIALNSNKNDDAFETNLIDRISNCFELFDVKQKLMKNKIPNRNERNTPISNVNLQDSIKAISFFGLNEAVEFHCGIELDRTKTSETFAGKILDLMCRIIQEEVNETSNNYIFTQPHPGLYLKIISDSMKINFKNSLQSSYSPCITRKNAEISLEKQIDVFNRLKGYIHGGSIFYLPKEAKFESVDLLNDSKMSFRVL
jgi:DNA-binding HxlR family transcriptional regulator